MTTTPLRQRLRALLLALPLLLIPATGQAQSQSAGGSIEGTVADETGAVLPGVTVVIKNVETGLSRETVTDASGIYRAPLLPVGNYEVSAELQGFAKVRRPDLNLTIGATLTIDLTLRAAVSEEITVTAEAPVL